MKRYLRQCLLILLSFALSFSGMAGVQSSSDPCPMKTAGVAQMSGMNHNCCDDSSVLSDHGKPCKPGQECKTASALQVSYVKPAGLLTSSLVNLSINDDLPTPSPSGVWRPPRF